MVQTLHWGFFTNHIVPALVELLKYVTDNLLSIVLLNKSDVETVGEELYLYGNQVRSLKVITD